MPIRPVLRVAFAESCTEASPSGRSIQYKETVALNKVLIPRDIRLSPLTTTSPLVPQGRLCPRRYSQTYTIESTTAVSPTKRTRNGQRASRIIITRYRLLSVHLRRLTGHCPSPASDDASSARDTLPTAGNKAPSPLPPGPCARSSAPCPSCQTTPDPKRQEPASVRDVVPLLWRTSPILADRNFRPAAVSFVFTLFQTCSPGLRNCSRVCASPPDDL